MIRKKLLDLETKTKYNISLPERDINGRRKRV